MPLKIVRNDITRMEVDAIVNTANEHMMVGTGCDYAIYQAAGYDELLAYRREHFGERQEGDVFVTPGFRLPAKYIIHAVSPLYKDGQSGEEEKLRACYRGCLKNASELGISSLAFPLIATGGFGYPKEEGLRIAMDEINAFLMREKNKKEMQIYIVVFGEATTKLGQKLYPDLQAYIDANYVEDKEYQEYGGFLEGRVGRASRRRGSITKAGYQDDTDYANYTVGSAGKLRQEKPSLGKPSWAQPGLAKPGLAEPGLAKPDRTEPGLAEPGLAKPDLTEKGHAKRKMSEVMADAMPMPSIRRSEPESLGTRKPESLGTRKPESLGTRKPAPLDEAEMPMPMCLADESFDFEYDNEDGDFDFSEKYGDALRERMEHLDDTFTEYLLYLIQEKGLTNAKVYQDAYIDKKAFSKIKNNKYAHPKKDTVLRLCMGARLNYDEAVDLMARAGYAFSPCDKLDVIFRYFIEKGIYDMLELDIFLEEMGMPCFIA